MADSGKKPVAVEASEIAASARNAGVAGAGGAGFPAYAKWERLDEVDALMINHQESEPNYYMDRWTGREEAVELADFLDSLLEDALDLVVVATKEKYRKDGWTGPLERELDATVYEPDDLPVDRDETSGAVIAYTDDVYQYGMESVLLRVVGDTVIGDDLPMDHGWLVQNTETLRNLVRAVGSEEPVTRKYAHVDGDTPRHRFFDVPVGTPASALLEGADVPVDALADDAVLADGGPGWCFRIDDEPADFGVTKRTNCILVLDEETVEDHTFGGERVNVLEDRDWNAREHEREPVRLEPDHVKVPLMTNTSLRGLVQPSVPTVEVGDEVEVGDVVARPADEGFSIAQHASIDGTVTDVTDLAVEITR